MCIIIYCNFDGLLLQGDDHSRFLTNQPTINQRINKSTKSANKPEQQTYQASKQTNKNARNQPIKSMANVKGNMYFIQILQEFVKRN